MSIGSAVFAGLMIVTQTDRLTDHTTLSVTKGHIYIVLRCSLIIITIIVIIIIYKEYITAT